jgi:pimeloyl-ACP methyl ester carboxylesterase
MTLEIISRKTQSKTPGTPLLFVHGAYVGAWCWEENFLDWFAERGYPAYAVSLRGHGNSAGHERLNDFGLADYAEDVALAVAQLPAPPVLIGHSMGALVVQKFLERVTGGHAGSNGVAPALVLACPVPAYGVVPSSLALAFTRPALFAGLNAVASGGRAPPHVLGEALFGVLPAPEQLARCYRRMQGESRRALLDMTGWGLPSLWRNLRPPTLVIGAGRDVLVPAAQAQGTAHLLNAEFRLLPELGHAVMLDAGWLSAAQEIADWLEERGL